MTSMKSLLLAGSALFAATTMMPVQAAPTGRAITVAQMFGGKTDAQKKKEEEEKKKAKKPVPPQPAAKPKKPAAVPFGHPKPPAAAKQAPPHRPAPPRPAQAAPVHKPTPPAKQAAPAAQRKPPAGAPAARHAGPERRDHRRRQPPQSAPQQAAPAAAQQAPAPTAAPSKPAPSKSAAPIFAPQQAVKPRDAREFIRKDGNQPQRTIKDVRQERRTTRQNGRVSIHEGSRTIVRENNRTIIRHNEDQRFAIGARNVRVDHRNGETFTVILRPDGIRIVNVTDREGHLIRRLRRDRSGRDFVIIDNRRAGPGGMFVDVRPPRIGMPRDRYIIDADRADEREIYDLLTAPPVETIERDYSLTQVRYSAALRGYMRRLDLDIHFDTGSWQLTPAQMDRLSLVAEALNRAIDRHPREVYLIEGHTDAVGSEDDNLSLSDRRAESVAVALTEAFHVPAENLVTQGYGEQELKVPTQGPSRINRRVAIRRITPLIDRTARR